MALPPWHDRSDGPASHGEFPAKRRRDRAVPPPTGRMYQVWALLAHGASAKEIAAALGVSYGTVRCLCTELHRRTDTQSNLELVTLYYGGTLYRRLPRPIDVDNLGRPAVECAMYGTDDAAKRASS